MNRIQKWLQGIQGPCGSFRNFNIKIKYMLKPPIPRVPCPESNRIYAQGLRCDKFLDFALVHLFSRSERQMSLSALNGTDIDSASFDDRFSSWTCVHACLTCLRVRKEHSVGKTLLSVKRAVLKGFWLCSFKCEALFDSCPNKNMNIQQWEHSLASPGLFIL